MGSEFGRTVLELNTVFESGVLPSWLTLRSDSNSSGDWGGSTQAPCTTGIARGVTLTAAAGASKNVGVAVALGSTGLFDLGSSELSCVELEFAMTGVATTTNELVAGFNTTNYARGLMLERPAGAAESPTNITAYNGAARTRKPITRLWEQVGTAYRYNWGIRLIRSRSFGGPSVRVGQIYQGDSVLFERTFTTAELPSGTMRAEISSRGTAAGAGGQVLHLHRATYREHYL